MKGLWTRWRRRARVDLTCGCGESFIPGAWTPGQTRRYGCNRCGTKLILSTFRGPINW